MNINYDIVADAIYIKMNSGKVNESIEIKDGIIIDYLDSGEILGLEIINFSKRKIDLNEIIKLKSEEIISRIVTG